jgi:flagellar biosynthesis/type III secretory pathway M-ring protein FliF/YscJ
VRSFVSNFWRDFSINRKIPLLAVSMTLMACTLVAVVAAGTSFHTTSSLLSGHLQYVANSKRDAIVAMLDTAKREIEALQTNPALQEAADTLDMASPRCHST